MCWLMGYILHHLTVEKDSKLPFKFVRRCWGPQYRRVAGTMKERWRKDDSLLFTLLAWWPQRPPKQKTPKKQIWNKLERKQRDIFISANISLGSRKKTETQSVKRHFRGTIETTIFDFCWLKRSALRRQINIDYYMLRAWYRFYSRVFNTISRTSEWAIWY